MPYGASLCSELQKVQGGALRWGALARSALAEGQKGDGKMSLSDAEFEQLINERKAVPADEVRRRAAATDANRDAKETVIFGFRQSMGVHAQGLITLGMKPSEAYGWLADIARETYEANEDQA